MMQKALRTSLFFFSVAALAASPQKVSHVRGKIVAAEKMFRAENPDSPPDSKTSLPKTYWNVSIQIAECKTTVDGKPVAAEYKPESLLNIYLPGELKIDVGSIVSGTTPANYEFNPVLADVKIESTGPGTKTVTTVPMSFDLPKDVKFDEVDGEKTTKGKPTPKARKK